MTRLLLFWQNIMLFVSTLHTVSSMCGQTIYPKVTTSNIILRHPNYPFDYLPDTDCTYTFRKDPVLYSSPNHFLVLKFYTSNYEIHGKLPDCTMDFLEITVGDSEDKKFKFCSNSIPPTVYSADGVIKFRIFAQSNSEGGSFTARVNVRSVDLGPSCLTTIEYGKTGTVTSPNYPRGYQNETCDKRIFVDSQKAIDLFFIDLDLVSGGNTAQCEDGDSHDFVEVRGASKSTTTYLEATKIKTRQCGSLSQITKFVHLKYNYIYIRFSSKHITYNSTGHTLSRGINIGYAIYDSKDENNSEGSFSFTEGSTPNALLWFSIFATVIFLIVVIWIIIYKLFNRKKKNKAVRPAQTPDALVTTNDTIIINNHMSQQQQQQQQQRRPNIAEPDYNPAVLFAAKPVVDMNSDVPQDGVYPDPVFPIGKDDYTVGLSPGYIPGRYESNAGNLT